MCLRLLDSVGKLLPDGKTGGGLHPSRHFCDFPNLPNTSGTGRSQYPLSAAAGQVCVSVKIGSMSNGQQQVMFCLLFRVSSSTVLTAEPLTMLWGWTFWEELKPVMHDCGIYINILKLRVSNCEPLAFQQMNDELFTRLHVSCCCVVIENRA